MDYETHGQGEGERPLEEAQENQGFGAVIGCLTYQSRASAPPSDAELNDLVQRARARNNSVGVTGMLLYEDGRFLQTLEGPPDGLAQIWASIRQDERHQEIEVLSEHLVPGRLFSEWDLLLYRKRDAAPAGLWERLQRRQPLARYIPAVVKYALNADERALNDLFAKLMEKGCSGDEIAESVIEPAARAMGDAWLADECSEFDLTFGLGILQVAGHALRYHTDPGAVREHSYSILLASAPGEPHMLSPTLLADQFTDAGWSVEMAFPDTDEALANQVSEQTPDAIDIASSDAISRIDRVAHVRDAVKRARFAMPEKPLVVSVGGRLFAEALATAEHVGADMARHSMAGTQLRIAQLVEYARTMGKTRVDAATQSSGQSSTDQPPPQV
ncbi:MAG: BLUF domain-containing protein [Pseudomonadota bacterium]